MVTPLIGQTPNITFPGGACFFGLGTAGLGVSATENQRQGIIATGGTINNLYVQQQTAPGAGTTRTYTLRVNGADTALTCTVSGTGTTASDTTHSVSVSAGDSVCLGVTETGGPTLAQGNIQVIASFNSTSAGESVWMGTSDGNDLSTTSTDYIAPVYGGASTATEANVTMTMPTAGTLSKFYGKLDVAPGGGATRVFTLRKNGADTALTFTFGAGDTSKNDTTHSVSYVAGDTISISMAITGTPAASKAWFGLLWTPTISGECVLQALSSSSPSNTATRYNVVDGSASWSTSEAGVQSYTIAGVLKKLYVNLTTAPGAGKSRAFRSRVNTANGNLLVTIADTATSGSDTSNSDTVSLLDLINFVTTPTGTPAGAGANSVSMVFYIAAPASATNASFLLNFV